MDRKIHRYGDDMRMTSSDRNEKIPLPCGKRITHKYTVKGCVCMNGTTNSS